MTKQLYILLADNGRAKVFRSEMPLTSLEIVYDQVHFQGKKKPSEIYSDRPGSQPSGAGGFHSFAGERSTHEDEHFARELCKFIEGECRAGKFDALVVAAPPHFLGELRKHLPRECEAKLVGSYPLDLVKMPNEAIIDHLGNSNPALAARSAV